METGQLIEDTDALHSWQDMRAAPSEKAPPLTHETVVTRRAFSSRSPPGVPDTTGPLRRVDRRVGTWLMCRS